VPNTFRRIAVPAAAGSLRIFFFSSATMK
jgi:hypothetical protein